LRSTLLTTRTGPWACLTTESEEPAGCIALFVAALYEALSVIFVMQGVAPCQLEGVTEWAPAVSLCSVNLVSYGGVRSMEDRMSIFPTKILLATDGSDR
jgi:hypothetical protein